MGNEQFVTSEPVLSVIIVNWNTREHLALCLASLRAFPPPFTMEIIVVDNNSSDGSASYVRTEWPSAVLIANTGNRGFAGGVNDGLRAAGGKYIMLMNPDIQVHSRCLELLVGFIEGHPGAGGVMPDLRRGDGSPQEDYIRRIPGLGQVLCFHTILEPLARRIPFLVHRFLEEEVPGGAATAEVDQIPGAVLLTRREVVEKIGPMDEGFRLFYEDVDWCLKMKDLGWKLVLDREATVTHAGGGSFRGDAAVWQSGRFLVSLMRFFDCHRPGVTSLAIKFILLANSALVLVMRSAGLAFFRNDPGGKRKFSRARHLYFLKLFYLVYVTKNDPGLYRAPATEPAL